MVCEGLLIVRPIWICPEMGHPKISLVCHFFPGVYCTLLRRETPMWYVRFMHHHTLASLYHHTVMVCISKPQIGGYIVPLSNYLTAKSCLVAFFLVPQSPSRVLKPPASWSGTSHKTFPKTTQSKTSWPGRSWSWDDLLRGCCWDTGV